MIKANSSELIQRPVHLHQACLVAKVSALAHHHSTPEGHFLHSSASFQRLAECSPTYRTLSPEGTYLKKLEATLSAAVLRCWARLSGIFEMFHPAVLRTCYSNCCCACSPASVAPTDWTRRTFFFFMFDMLRAKGGMFKKKKNGRLPAMLCPALCEDTRFVWGPVICHLSSASWWRSLQCDRNYWCCSFMKFILQRLALKKKTFIRLVEALAPVSHILK